jgi:hypothetical protein
VSHHSERVQGVRDVSLSLSEQRLRALEGLPEKDLRALQIPLPLKRHPQLEDVLRDDRIFLSQGPTAHLERPCFASESHRPWRTFPAFVALMSGGAP